MVADVVDPQDAASFEDIGDLPELPPADQLISRRIFADGVSPPGHRDRQVLRDILLPKLPERQD